MSTFRQLSDFRLFQQVSEHRRLNKELYKFDCHLLGIWDSEMRPDFIKLNRKKAKKNEEQG